MIGILDPAILLPLDSERTEDSLCEDIEMVIRSCRSHNIHLVRIEPYWRYLWKTLGDPLEKQASPPTRRSIQQLRKLGNKDLLPPLPDDFVRVWGFHHLFGIAPLGEEWKERLTRSTLRAVLSGEETIMFVRLLEGRNLTIHKAENVTLDEITRWVLHIQPKRIGPIQILCVSHCRNLDLHWTSRFDWRLPAEEDGAKYPFCPSEAWWKGSVEAHRTKESRPCWADKLGNFWARPNMPGGRGYHWDVYLDAPGLAARLGFQQLNITAFGGPQKEGVPGSIHHPPEVQAMLKNRKGWSC